MDKTGVIPKEAACTNCNGAGCEQCQRVGRKYKCVICGKYDCEHLNLKKGEGKADDKKARST